MSRFFDRNENDRAIAEVRRHYLRDNLVLFIGAGVTASCGLPLWNELSRRILAVAFPQTDEGWGSHNHTLAQGYATGKGALDAMRIARKRLKEEFTATVEKALYRDGFETSETVTALSRLNRVKLVCSYNYDDLFERALASTGSGEVISIVDGREWTREPNSTIVFHPHGLLPSNGGDDRSAKIVLSEDDYHRLYSEPYSWANLVQLKLLMSGTALFVGCSLLDPNIRRLLDVVRKLGRRTRHYALLRDPAGSVLDRTQANGWDGIRVGPIIGIEQDALDDRGIVPIWYDNHSDIPGVVDQLLSEDGLRGYGTRRGERDVIDIAVAMYREGKTIWDISYKLNSSNSYPPPRGLGEANRAWWDGREVAQLLAPEGIDVPSTELELGEPRPSEGSPDVDGPSPT